MSGDGVDASEVGEVVKFVSVTCCADESIVDVCVAIGIGAEPFSAFAPPPNTDARGVFREYVSCVGVAVYDVDEVEVYVEGGYAGE